MTKINYKSEGEIKACYEGEVRDKKPHGRGDLTFANGDILFSKEFDPGVKPGEGVINNGEGKFVYAKKTGETGQDSYNGKIDGNVSHGNGTYIIANSGDFEGRFSNGYPTKGTYITQRGDEYAVRWDRDGKQWWLMVDGKEVPLSSTREQNPPTQQDTSQQSETATEPPQPEPKKPVKKPTKPPKTPECTHKEQEWKTVKEPACTVPGIQKQVCTKCHKTLKTETIKAIGHAESDWIIDKEATCTEAGSRHKECTVCGKVLETETIKATGHKESDWIVDQKATCTEPGSKHKECIVCGMRLKTETIKALGHTPSDWIVDQKATCTEPGSKHKECTVCGKTLKIETIEALGHNYVNGVCSRCGHRSPYTRKGNTIYFGMYPQSKVTDGSLRAKLTSLAGTLPTDGANRKWTSYGYYISGRVSNFMWYIDIENDGAKYRGVYFTSYLPFLTAISSSSGNSRQCDNGYQTSTVYWFKYEPVKWRILEESGGKAFLLADIAIDSHEYHPSSNDYANSTIRTWLNDTFYNTAFNDLQKELIQTTTVDNSVSSTGYSSNAYACANTSDKVFLLSYKEATTYLTSNSARIRKSTDYAKSQGCLASTSSGYVGNCWWWLRSPNDYNSRYARSIGSDGSVGYSYYVDYTYYGVVPALWIAL